MSEYTCDECGGTFPSSGHLGAHIAGAHSSGSFPEKVSDEELLDAIQALANELGHVPSTTEMAEQGKYSHKVCMKRFGSWNEALERAGLPPNKRQNIPQTELINEISRLAVKIGRPPSSTEMTQQGQFSRDIYFERFGSWSDALEAAGYERPLSYVDDHQRLPYGTNWSEQRQKALERDGYVCQSPRCSITSDDHRATFGEELHVHHIIPRKHYIAENGELLEQRANSLGNLITLCAQHHHRWEKFTPLIPDIR